MPAGRPKGSLNKPKAEKVSTGKVHPCLKCRKPVKGWLCHRCRDENRNVYEMKVHKVHKGENYDGG